MNEGNEEQSRWLILMRSFWNLKKVIMTQVKQKASDYDLSVPQFAIMSMMQRRGSIPQKELRLSTHYPKSTLSHAIEGLVQEGLMERSHVEGNRREMSLSLSEDGKVLFEKMMKEEHAVHATFKKAVDSLTEEEFTQLIHMHHQIASYFESGEKDDSGF